MKYDYTAIEKKWQGIWDEQKAFECELDRSKKKFYGLIEFPYPSGAGLHVGHPRPYTAIDIVARKKRMEGYNVLFPIGFDAFGLPTENYAIQNHMHPRTVTETNIAHFTEQLKSLGFSFCWDRVVDTTDPNYYKWTQWIFLKLFENGLAYKSQMPVNWCTSCKCVLANEEVVEGVCERCGSPVVRKEKSQWMLKITEYAQRLIDDLDDVDFIERVKIQQRNWIGRSTGAEVQFDTTAGDRITVFTTRPDTLFGTTYMVISPEHSLIEKWADRITNMDEIRAYQAEAARKSDFERTELNKDKTGVEIKGVKAINLVTGNEMPIFLSDYVLATYGTGIVMGVPGHDQRDWDFATAFGLPIIEVVEGGDITKCAFVAKDDSAILVNSDFLNGMTVKEAVPAMTKWLVEKGIGKEKINYKLRDWVFSRQRYWGEPIPLVNCPKCGWVALPESELPLLLPEVESYEPTDNGESPLAKMTDWVNTTCPKCGGPAQRETDTMPQWAGSSWYFLRYIDPKNNDALASQEAMDYWMPVDWYNGGMEHTTLHLLYSRFWHKFLYDIGVASTKEPYAKRTSHGMILGLNPRNFANLPEDEQKALVAETGSEEAAQAALVQKYGEMANHPIVKMSKSLGNVVNPDDVVRDYGADTMRTYIMFLGDFEKAAPWQANAVKGCKRFLDRVWNLAEGVGDAGDGFSAENESLFHKSIKKVTEDIDNLKANTAIAQLMTLLSQLTDKGCNRFELGVFIRLLSPFAPHICEEIWQQHGFEGLCSLAQWPEYDPEKCKDATVEMAIQVNGKLRGTLTIEADAADEDVIARAKSDEKILRFLEKNGGQIRKEIVVKNKLVNLIVK